MFHIFSPASVSFSRVRQSFCFFAVALLFIVTSPLAAGTGWVGTIPFQLSQEGDGLAGSTVSVDPYGEDEEEIEIDGFTIPINTYGEDEEEIEIDGFGVPVNPYGEDEEEIEIDGFGAPVHPYGEDEEEIEIDGFGVPVSPYGEDEEEIEIDGFGIPIDPYGEDEEEIEIDGFGASIDSYDEDEEEIEIDGFTAPAHPYGEDEEGIEIDGLQAPPQGRTLVSMLDQLCRQSLADDHGDSLTCATFLIPDRVMFGEMGAESDVDIFQFVISGSPATDRSNVVLEVVGDVELSGALYDDKGRKIDVDFYVEYGEGLQILRSLGAGTYFVRLKGHDGSEGSYGLRVGASP